MPDAPSDDHGEDERTRRVRPPTRTRASSTTLTPRRGTSAGWWRRCAVSTIAIITIASDAIARDSSARDASARDAIDREVNIIVASWSTAPLSTKTNFIRVVVAAARVGGSARAAGRS